MDKCYQVCELPPETYPYRGVQRLGPYPSENAKDNPRLHSECIKYFANDGKLERLEEARMLWDSLGESRWDFEIIRVVPSRLANCNRQLLGFDVVEEAGWNSLLSWDWFASKPSAKDLAPNLVLVRLIFEHFAGKINGNRLFEDKETAHQFSSAANALNELAAGTFESSQAGDLRVLAVYEEIL